MAAGVDTDFGQSKHNYVVVATKSSETKKARERKRGILKRERERVAAIKLSGLPNVWYSQIIDFVGWLVG